MKQTHSSSYFARLFIALAAVLLTACQSDDGYGKDDGETMGHGTTVDLSFRMNVSAGTRNANDNYFQNEHTISHLELFFFDAQTKKLVNRATFDNLTQDKDPSNLYYDNSYIIQSISMNVGVYNIFAVANYNDILLLSWWVRI